MSPTAVTIQLKVNIKVEQREGYFAAITSPFAITVYGDTQDEAEESAQEAVEFLLRQYGDSLDSLTGYLNRRGVEHLVRIDDEPKQRRSVTRDCTQEMRVPVG